MNRALVISVTSALIGYGLLLVIAGPVILLCVAVICFVWCIGFLARSERRPIGEFDERCARVDADLIRREQEAKRAAMAGARSIQGGGGFRAR